MSEHITWNTHPEAAKFVQELLDSFLKASPFLRNLSVRLRDETGTRLLDWVHCLFGPPSLAPQMEQVGYQSGSHSQFTHPGGMFPDVCLDRDDSKQIWIQVVSVADFILAHRLMGRVELHGSPLSSNRSVMVSQESGVQTWMIEIHGSGIADPAKILKHHEAFRLRNRDFPTDREGFDHARQLIRASIADLGIDRTCDLFFQAEREYWQMRNRAARIQKARQDALGMGWANHDHHTYRSGREGFAPLIAILEELGFHCRERFYAGKDAGWGAQVLEQPNVGVVIFADVDLSPEEVTGDFAHEPLPHRKELGTVGLWCALHGEAFLQAGMHHLECQFDFDAAREQLKPLGIECMKPFTDFAYLRQAFTKGEVWPVEESRIEKLLADGRITDEQAMKFRTNGALGSHLEILQRNDGYKGFNQTGINEIILKTDPRSANHSH